MAVWKIEIDGRPFEVDVQRLEPDSATVVVDGRTYQVGIEAASPAPVALPGVASRRALPAPVAVAPTAAPSAAQGVLNSPLPGMILDVLVQVGDRVEAGQVVLKIEAMKMENEVRAVVAGGVQQVFVQKGDTVLDGAKLMLIG